MDEDSKEHKCKTCTKPHGLRRLHELTNEMLEVEKHLLPPDQDEFFLHNFRCLGKCGEKRIVSPKDEKNEPWHCTIKEGTGAKVHHCDGAITGMCDMVICGECAKEHEINENSVNKRKPKEKETNSDKRDDDEKVRKKRKKNNNATKKKRNATKKGVNNKKAMNAAK